MSEGPFEVLRLPPDSSEEEIVLAGAQLRRRATDDATLNAIRQAVQALTAGAEERALLALLTHPRPTYRWPALERLVAAFRRPPAVSAAPCPPLDMTEWTDLLVAAVAQELEAGAATFEPIDGAEGAEEVRRQTVEALWQALLADMRA